MSAVKHQTFVGTVIQSAPRLRELIAHMQPTWHLRSIADLDSAFLGRHGIHGLIWDVDGTLTANRGRIADRVAESFEALLANDTLRHVVLSNADEARYRELGSIFPTVPIIRGYRDGDALFYRHLVGIKETWSPGAPISLDGAVAIRKPSAELVHEAVRVLGVDAHAAVMVGDQYLTDIAGANMAGIRSVKLRTFARGTFPLPVQVAQVLETAVHRLLHGSARRSQ